MNYPTYLVHYNKNHSKANGQFTSGDGDGDGISNDHANQKKKKGLSKKAKIGIGVGIAAASITATAAALVADNIHNALATNRYIDEKRRKTGEQYVEKFKKEDIPSLIPHLLVPNRMAKVRAMTDGTYYKKFGQGWKNGY